jgi:PelA/Pel-15E family pectate lyase
MNRREFVLSTLSAPLVLSGFRTPVHADTRTDALAALKRAAVYMDEVVSYRGGYVWSYAPDFSKQLGEMEAYRTMCWLQPPGTASIGHVYLDAYYATGDKRFFQAAKRTALAVKQAQRANGGWNYIHDFAGETSLKRWYNTIGRNGWRLEEFQHYYGNSTFDDATTAVAAQLMLRMYLETDDEIWDHAVHKVIDFILDAQFGPELGIADGGWPQRFPHNPDAISSMPMPNAHQLPPNSWAGMEDGDYTLHVTFNDDVMGENIKFLTMCVMSLGKKHLVPKITRAMECMRRLQQPAPQAGWSLQHLSRPTNGRPAGAPAGARTYEPRSLATHTTQTNVQQLFHYFELTGDRRYLQRIPEAIAWLKTCPLPADAAERNPLLRTGQTHPTFIQLSTNDGIYVHRYGSNIHNGAYYFNKDYTNTLSHYSAGRNINIPALEARYNLLASRTDAEIAARKAASPLYARTRRSLPKYFTVGGEVDFPHLFEGAVKPTLPVPEADVIRLVSELNANGGRWLTPLPETVNPFIGDGPTAPYLGTAYMSKHVGDLYDTSPYPADNPPDTDEYEPMPRPPYIVSRDWISRMGQLIGYISPVTS